MNKNYKLLMEGVRARTNPDNIILNKAFSNELSTISYSDVLTYIRLAMNGVEPEYTQKSKDAGEKVKEHLKSGLTSVDYRYQGSIMTDTQIIGFSDIDLLTICDKFYNYDSHNIEALLESSERMSKLLPSSIKKLENEINVSQYTGNSIDDLKNLRKDSERILMDKYKICDISNAKAIKIKNLSLNRNVDIVIANWFDDITSIINDKGDYRGIQIYNKDTNSKEKADYPFLSINRINQRSSETNGRLKKMIRFLKNIKAASGLSIDLSSFDFNAITYDIKVTKYQNSSFFQLVPVLYDQLLSIGKNQAHWENLVSVDGREYIFRGKPEKLSGSKESPHGN